MAEKPVKRDKKGRWAKGTRPGPGRKVGYLSEGIARLADEAAEALLKRDLRLITKKAKSKAAKARKERAKERVARMCKGRVPTRVAISGEEGAPPVPFAYVQVGVASPRPETAQPED